MIKFRWNLAGWLAVVWPVMSVAATYRLTLPAAPEIRAGEVIRFGLPTGAPRPFVLRDESNRLVATQIGDGSAVQFVVGWQQANQTLHYRLAAGSAAPASSGVEVTNEKSRLQLNIAGIPALVYQMDPDALPRPDIDPKYKRAGYLHPVFTPSGQDVSGDYPSNHPHHHGIWSAWTKTEFQGRLTNFWDMQTQKGTEQFVSLSKTWSGPVAGGFIGHHQMIDLTAPHPTAALDETWVVTAYRLPGAVSPVHLFDLAISQTCATADPVQLKTFLYGGLGIRGRDEWNDLPSFRLLTSTGVTDRAQANGVRARWCYLGGTMPGGAQIGTAVLCAPDNFRAPQPIRVHPAMPYFCYAPSSLGDWSIAPDHPYAARFRFVVMDGVPDPAALEAYWNGFAHPALARLEAQ